MDVRDDSEPANDEEQAQQMPAPAEPEPHLPVTGAGPDTIAVARRAAQADIGRTRSPTPPKALFRSTTGKGVAFTDEDVTFLVRFLEYRNRTQAGKVDMVTFWKDVAAKVYIVSNIPRRCPLIIIACIGSSPFARILDEVLSQAQA